MRVRQRKRRGAERRYKKGGHYKVSDQSGLVYRAGDTVEQWDGLIVGRDELERRHPQEYVRGVYDDYAIRSPRPRAQYEFVIGSFGIKDRAGNIICSRAGVPLQGRPRNVIVIPGDITLTTRENFSVCDRSGRVIESRVDLLSVSTTAQVELAFIDLGSEQYVSRACVKIESLDKNKKFLNLYTSNDDIIYEPVSQELSDIIANIPFGTEKTVPIGKDVRYLSIRYKNPLNLTEGASGVVSKFEVYGC